MRCKPGVNVNHLRPELFQLFPTVEQVFWAFNKYPVITSTDENPSTHIRNSLHGHNLAFDLRTNHLGEFPARVSLFKCLKAEIDRLYPGYYDVLHENKQTPQEHIHIEASPLLCGLIEGSQKEVA